MKTRELGLNFLWWGTWIGGAILLHARFGFGWIVSIPLGLALAVIITGAALLLISRMS